MEVEIIDENGDLVLPISALYALLRRKLCSLRGRYLVARGGPCIPSMLSLDEGDRVPEVSFCPAGEPDIVTYGGVLGRVCIEVYKYFEDRCAACAVKVFSILGEEWLIDEDTLIELLSTARDYSLPVEWSKGCIVLTTCPEDYSVAKEQLKTGDYIKGLQRLEEAITKFVERTGYRST